MFNNKIIKPGQTFANPDKVPFTNHLKSIDGKSADE